MKRAFSLRARLTVVILSPLLALAGIIGIWVYGDAQSRAAERFDLSLLSTALSISRDTAVTGGDALSETTRDLLRDTSGGAVFYHVYAPDGVFVTGYATPPVPPIAVIGTPEKTYYDAIYQGQTVRALRFTQSMSIDNINGLFTFTVWQNTSLRDGFVQGRTTPTFLVMAFLVGAIAIAVWFGVRFGLTPLRDLENAIEQRSPDDLSPIKRRIPMEVSGIVGKLNTLLGELDDTIVAKDRFISNAAHQLRNPIAGVLSLAEAVQNAKSLDDVMIRSVDLVDAARQTSNLANNLLALERARATSHDEEKAVFALSPLVERIADSFEPRAVAQNVAFQASIATGLPTLSGDAVMLEQAILNLLNNAVFHGGATLTKIEFHASCTADKVTIAVRDDGIGIAENDLSTAMAHFGQVEPSAGSGLGLPIAIAVAEAFGGAITPINGSGQFSISMVLPYEM
jgi:two-component system sensor histidine kinase TctE